jgi:hypothetical protein
MQQDKQIPTCRLVRSAWLVRVWEIIINGKTYRVEYNGWGMGYESVIVNGEVVARFGTMTAMVPKFDFVLDQQPVTLLLNANIWGKIYTMQLQIADHIVYSEGDQDYLNHLPSVRPIAFNTNKVTDDDQPLLPYFMLSPRRRFYRSLYAMPSALLFLLFPLMQIASWRVAFLLVAVGIFGFLIQATYEYKKWQKER